MSAEPSDPSSKADLERRRVPLERKISLKFKEFRGFITEYSSNLSMGGMFIRTNSPKPVGTIFDFELSLTDDFKLVQGIGEVIWVREADDGPERPSGMGVRFLDLSRDSRRLIQRIVEEQVAHGGTPFELEPPGFPPPPLRPPLSGAPSPRSTGQSAVFHATAAPVSAAPPPPRPAARPAAPTPKAAAGAGPPAPPPLPRPAQQPAPPARPAPRPSPVAPAPPPPGAELFSELAPPELPAPEVVPDRTDLLPDLGEAWGGEALEGFSLEDADETAESSGVVVEPLVESSPLGDIHDEPTLLKGVRPLAAPGVASSPSPWVAPPAPSATAPPPAGSARGRTLPSGFDEVARAFGEPATAAEPAADSTRRVPLVVPAAPAAAIPTPSRSPEPPARPARGFPRPPFSAPPRRGVVRRRRSWMPLVAALVLAVVAGVGVVYLRFPELLPEWARAPRLAEPVDGSTPAGEAARPGAAPLPRPAAGTDSASTHGASPGGPLGGGASPGTSSVPQAPPSPGDGRTPTAPAGTRPPAATDAADPRSLLSRGGNATTSRFSSIEEIWGQRSGPGTLVTIVTNGAVPPDAYSHFRLEGASPREVIRLRGVDDSYRRSSIPVATGEVKQLRLGYHAKPDGNELHVVVDLNSPRVGLLQIRPVDNRLELLFVLQR